MRKSIISFVAAVVFLWVVPGYAQVSLNAPPEDRVYQAIDIFIANDLVHDVIMGQRPFSRMEVARILRKSRESLSQWKIPNDSASAARIGRWMSKRNYIGRLLTYYEREYAVELEGMKGGVRFDLLKRMDQALIYNSSVPRTIPVSNGQGGIDGIITSFDRYDQGLTYPDGALAYISTQHDLYLTRYVAVTAQPRFEFATQMDGNSKPLAHIHRLYMKAGWRNIELEVGRDNLLWGQAEYGGLFASANPRPLDMIKLSNPYPFRFPWVFKYLGHNKFTFFVSNLGPERFRSYAYLYGLKWSLRPSRYFEIGFTHTVMMGGNGAPGVKWWEPIAELMPFHKWGGANIGATDIANNAFGFFEFRVTIPQWRGVSLYYEAYIEDSIVRVIRLPSNILNQLAFCTGLYLPRITDSGSTGLRLEYHHMAPLAYRHSSWQSGYTLNRRPIGDPLGPTADGIYAMLYWRPRPRLSARASFAYEDFDSSIYMTEPNASGGGGDRILKSITGPHEYRYRTEAGVSWRSKKRYELNVSAGYEHIRNWDFDVGRSVNNVFLRGMLTLYFDEFTFSTR